MWSSSQSVAKRRGEPPSEEHELRHCSPGSGWQAVWVIIGSGCHVPQRHVHAVRSSICRACFRHALSPRAHAGHCVPRSSECRDLVAACQPCLKQNVGPHSDAAALSPPARHQ
jgi:hypothetical protein